MRSLTHLISVALITLSICAEASPRRRIVQRDRNYTGQAQHRSQESRRDRNPRRARERVIVANPTNNPSPSRRVISSHRGENIQRNASSRSAQKHRRARRVERRNARRVEQKHSRHFERRKAQRHRRRVRREHKGSRALQNRLHNRTQYIPTYVSTPTRVIVTERDRPHNNNDQFFDHIYHDGSRYGVNGDLRDEERKINRGIRRGLITPTEADRLIDLLIDAYDLESEYISDGFLTQEEEADLYWAERSLNREIRWEMRDFDIW